jgi:hypothetical protein
MPISIVLLALTCALSLGSPHLWALSASDDGSSQSYVGSGPPG